MLDLQARQDGRSLPEPEHAEMEERGREGERGGRGERERERERHETVQESRLPVKG